MNKTLNVSGEIRWGYLRHISRQIYIERITLIEEMVMYQGNANKNKAEL